MADGREPYFLLPRTMPNQLDRLEVIDLTAAAAAASFGSSPSSSCSVEGILRADTSSRSSSRGNGIEWNVADLGMWAMVGTGIGTETGAGVGELLQGSRQ